MRTIAVLLLGSLVAFGQRAGGGAVHARSSSFSSNSGFGNVVFPGTGHPPGINNHPGAGLGVRPAPGAFVGGARLRGGRSIVYIPYGYGYGVGGYPYLGYPEDPSMGMYPQPSDQMPPQVVINQNFASETARPVVREYVTDSAGGIRAYDPSSASAAPAPADEPPTYLIAFKDHTIYAALAYWVEGDTLHYVTNQNTHNQVSLDLIDRELSTRFNRERNVDFHLPPAR
jgi:hypothetical protein